MIKRNPISAAAVMILIILMVGGRIWKPNPQPISWDVAGYYLYLPANIIHRDPGLKKHLYYDSLRVQYNASSSFYQITETPTKQRIIKYTMGGSILYAPFFLAGHAIAKAGGYPADGYSTPYQTALVWGMLLYSLIALLMLRKCLLSLFDDRITALTLIGITMGTNLFLMLSMDSLQVHCGLFFLYSLLIWNTIRSQHQPTVKKAIVSGIVCGMIVLMRPTDIISWAIPILWGVGGFGDLFIKLKTQWKYMFIMVVVAGIVFFPQALYWKMYAGTWLYNSYNNPGEGLDLFAPHTFNFLFSYRKGWILYTPLMLLIFAGFILLLKNNRRIFLPLVIFFIINLWIISSWTCWWYAGSFSARAMVQSYAILVIPLGYFIQYLFTKPTFFKHGLKGLFFLMIALCMFQTWQYAEHILKPDGMTKAFYWKSFGALSYDPENRKLLLNNKTLETDTLYSLDDYIIAQSIELNWTDSSVEEEPIRKRLVKMNNDLNYALTLDSTFVFFTIFERPYFQITGKYYAYCRIEGEIFNSASHSQNPVELVRTMSHNGGLYGYVSTPMGKNLEDSANCWQHFTLDYVFPDVRKPEDLFKAYLWLRGSHPVYCRNLKVSILEGRNFPELE